MHLTTSSPCVKLSVFDDEQELTTFLSLSEQGKQEFDGPYQVRDCDFLKELHQLWGIELEETISMTTNW